MPKHRITGRVGQAHYEIVSHSGEVLKTIPLDEVKDHSRLQKAIQRNGWETV